MYKDVKLVTEGGATVVVEGGTEQEFLVTYDVGKGSEPTYRLFYINRPLSWDENGQIDRDCLDWAHCDENDEEISMVGWYVQSTNPNFHQFYEPFDFEGRELINIKQV